jgi:hypothetical protein
MGVRLAVVLLLVAIGVGVTALVRRRRLAPRPRRGQPWAARTTQRLLRDGYERGRPRWRHETLREYAAALADDALPDPRVIEVATVLSDALFSDRMPDEATRRRGHARRDRAGPPPPRGAPPSAPPGAATTSSARVRRRPPRSSDPPVRVPAVRGRAR